MRTELPHLKEYVFNGEPDETYEVLVKMKRRLNRPDLKLFPAGFLFDTETLPADFDHDFYWGHTSALISFIKKHLSRFLVIDQIYAWEFPFNMFVDCFTEGIPEEMLRRLVQVKSFEVKAKVNDVGELMKVLEILGRGLDRVKIESSEMDQEIFDRLPEKCPILGEFSIKEENSLDLAFILRFKSLKIVQLHQQLNEEIARECFQKYENFLSFSFYEQDDCLKVSRSLKPPFQLTIVKISPSDKKQQKVSLPSNETIVDFDLPTLFDD